jgi:PKD repeat protein
MVLVYLLVSARLHLIESAAAMCRLWMRLQHAHGMPLLTITAAGGSSAVPPGTYYVTVTGSGDGYTDSVIIAVTVTAPNVAVTSPGNNAVFQSTDSNGNATVVTVSASADAQDGGSPLSTLTITADGQQIGGGSASPVSAAWCLPGDGKHTLTATATYAAATGRKASKTPG